MQQEYSRTGSKFVIRMVGTAHFYQSKKNSYVLQHLLIGVTGAVCRRRCRRSISIPRISVRSCPPIRAIISSGSRSPVIPCSSAGGSSCGCGRSSPRTWLCKCKEAVIT